MKSASAMLSALLLAICHSSLASYIAVATEFSMAESTDGSELVITTRNDGDETAFRVQHEVLIDGASQVGPAAARLNAGGQISSRFALAGLTGLPGQYPVVIWTRYQDANSYPFSALTVGFLDHLQPAVSKILLRPGELTIPANGDGDVTFTVRNADTVPRDLDLALHLPDELAVLNERHRLSLEPGGEVQVGFTVENFAALPGSSYAIALVAQYEDGERHFSAAAATQARITGPRRIGTHQAMVIAAAALVLAALVVAAYLVGIRKASQ